jgi:uncharacterized DUF497 family protein
MKNTTYEYSVDKNQWLINERHISFEEIVAALDNRQVLDVINHHNKGKYPHQKMYVIEVNNYVYLVPFVQMNEQTVFLKTIIPSRKAKKRYAKVEVSHEV